ncbi:hypothetical protein AB0J83_29645 [Actinoplanes sp. NPDC049596]|uniref:hypothetical protein n=1 Tax=unclassified Actinoplanes TaxID=2626549 RepID=UPI0034418608
MDQAIPTRPRGPVPAGAVAAVVLLAFASGATGLFALFILSFASDACTGASTALICTPTGQQAVTVGPLLAAAVGTFTAAGFCAAKPPWRTAGILLGYVIAFGAFFLAWITAVQA